MRHSPVRDIWAFLAGSNELDDWLPDYVEMVVY